MEVTHGEQNLSDEARKELQELRSSSDERDTYLSNLAEMSVTGNTAGSDLTPTDVHGFLKDAGKPNLAQHILNLPEPETWTGLQNKSFAIALGLMAL